MDETNGAASTNGTGPGNSAVVDRNLFVSGLISKLGQPRRLLVEPLRIVTVREFLEILEGQD